jgi:hypothetical protein
MFTFNNVFESRRDLVYTHCMGHLSKITQNDFQYRCTTRNFRKKYNLLNRSPFVHSKLSLIELLKILGLWCSNVRTKEISSLLDISRKTVGKFIKSCNEKLLTTFQNSFYKIGGPNITVEVQRYTLAMSFYHHLPYTNT